MNSFYLFESEWELEFNICGSIRIMSQLDMIVKTIVFASESEGLVPVHSCRFPFAEPFKFRSRLNKKLHLHLFKFSHPENELPGYYFIPECLTDLSNSKRYLHSSGLLNVQKIDKDSLCCFG